MKQTLLLAITIFCFSNLINAQAGQLDPSFGANGIVHTYLGDSYRSGSPDALQILSLPDGGFYVLQNLLSKRRANGALDSSFGIDGFAADVSFDAKKMAIEPDGKIIVGTYHDGLFRFNTDGSVDSSFSKNGKLINYYLTDLAVQKDGKIIFAGDNHSVFRYNTDASIDTTFSGDGHVTTNSFTINSIAIQNDGKIVAAGFNKISYDQYSDFKIVRYNIDGSLDNSFSGDGIQTTDFSPGQDFARSAAIQNDGKILAAGNSDGHFALARYNVDGSLDKSFSGDGKLTPDIPIDDVNSIAFQTDGKLVVSSRGTLIRVNTDGSLDRTVFKNTSFSYRTIAIQSDGKILAGGEGGHWGLALARYNTDGSLDNTFNGNGKLADFARPSNTGFKRTATQKDGKIVAAGSYWNGTNYDFTVTRYNTDGSPDNTFSGDGIQTTRFTSKNHYAKSVAIQNDGKIVVAGVHALARYNTDGSLDASFSGDGKQTTHDSIYITQVAIQSDGKILVAGEQNVEKDFNGDFGEDIGSPAVARYNTDGSVDKTFGADGKQTALPYGNSIVSSLVIQNDGKIVLGVFSYDDTYINDYIHGQVIVDRLNTNGSLDSTFNHSGFVSYYTEFYSTSCDIAKQNDDKIVIAATGDFPDDTYDNRTSLGRLNVDGTIDNSLNYAYYDYNSYYKVQNTSIAVQNNGKIVVAGIRLSRFNADGSNDATFNTKGLQEVKFDIQDINVANNKLYASGGEVYGTVARFLLFSNNTPPAVTLTAPANNAKYLAPAAHIKLNAAASDSGGTITKVEFYNGSTLLHTETVIPYGYNWKNVPLGNYTITAKAYDNSGNVTTSAAVHISVAANKAPVVSITKPANNQSFDAPATIHFEAAASDTDGRITKVEFYNGTTLLRTEYKYPYTYNWTNVPAGTYTITAKATDNWGAQTTSAPVTVTVTSDSSIVSSRPYSQTEKTPLNDALSLRLSPNPATNIVNIFTSGLQQNKPATMSIISISGIVLKTMKISKSLTQLNVSSLTAGVYTIKIVSADKIMHKQFVKL